MTTRSSTPQGGKKYPWTVKRIAAVVCIAALLAMYLITLALALTASPGTGGMFRASLLLTIALPVFCWIFIWAVGVLTHKKTIASVNLLNSNPQERAKMEEALAKQAAQDNPHAAQSEQTERGGQARQS